MKTCPTCSTQYSDDSLLFCLQDGSRLVSSPEANTVAFGDGDYSTAQSSRSAPPSEVTRVALPRESKAFTGPLVAGLAAIALLLGLGVIGLIAFIYLSSGGAAENANSNSTSPTIEVSNAVGSNSGVDRAFNRSAQVPRPPPNQNPTPSAYQTPAPMSDELRSEVSRQIYDWKAALESRNLNGLMASYAPTLNYFNRRGASRDAVRADKARAFVLYDDMKVNISNMNVTTDGNEAIATFDKEWTFTGSRSSSGKVRSQINLRRLEGRWLITGERDLKIYYSR
ncbi:MAG: hypothetical protein ABR530_08520 [Pyrinomonadaceae bacterium]